MRGESEDFYRVSLVNDVKHRAVCGDLVPVVGKQARRPPRVTWGSMRGIGGGSDGGVKMGVLTDVVGRLRGQKW